MQPADPDVPDPHVAVLLDALERLGADPAAVWQARLDGRLGALVVELSATGGGGKPFPVAVAEAGADPALAVALWRALGFPDPVQARATLLADDVRMLELMSTAAAELLGAEATLRLARVIGEATARIGDAVVGAFREQVEAPSRVAGAPYADIVTTYAALVAEALPGLQEAVGACVRRHVVQAAAGGWSLPEGEAQPRRDLVVGFVDLAGWTALSRATGHAALARMVQRFEELVAAAAAAHGVRVVKFMGDGAMIVAESGTEAVAFALDLVEAVGEDGSLPPVRVGLAAGPVLPSGGDYHGPTVNLAARLVAVAGPSTVLADDETRRRAAGATFDDPVTYELRGLADPMRASIARP